MFFDPWGCDAVIITDTNAVDLPVLGKQGHTSAIVQDNNGVWWYFYWGDKNVQLIQVDEWAMTNIDNFNKWLDPSTYSGEYNRATYIKGDFSEAYNYYKELFDSYDGGENENYSWYGNNCITMTVSGINKGVLQDDQEVLGFGREFYGIIPNIGVGRFEEDFYNNAFTYDDYHKQINDQLWEANHWYDIVTNPKTSWQYSIDYQIQLSYDKERLMVLY